MYHNFRGWYIYRRFFIINIAQNGNQTTYVVNGIANYIYAPGIILRWNAVNNGFEFNPPNQVL